MSGVAAPERLARAQLSELADPGDLVLAALLARCDPAALMQAVSSPGLPRASLPSVCGKVPGAERAFGRWRGRLPVIPGSDRLDAWERSRFRLVCPGEREWPTQPDDLGEAMPVMLWLRGESDLRFACMRSVPVVGSCAATAYGNHVGTELAADLASAGWTVISGGASGASSTGR